MKKLFYNNKDICEIYGISRTKAYKHIRIIREKYEIDESRLPRKGVLPAEMVKDYFKQGRKKGHYILTSC